MKVMILHPIAIGLQQQMIAAITIFKGDRQFTYPWTMNLINLILAELCD
jgi:hypothetical protein